MAGGTQNTEESGGPESRSRRQLPGSPGVLGKSRQSRPLLCSPIPTQPKGSQERKIEVPPKLASSQATPGVLDRELLPGEEQSRGTVTERDPMMSRSLHSPPDPCHTLSLLPSCPSLPRASLPSSQDAFSVLPACPRHGSDRQQPGCALWVGLLGSLPGTLGAPPGSLLKSGGGTLVVGKAFESAKLLVGMWEEQAE